MEIEGQRSNKEEIGYGMMQGSILGPLLFSIYINDLPQVPKRGKPEMFADDATLYCARRAVDEVTNNIESALLQINDWCKRNNLTIHS